MRHFHEANAPTALPSPPPSWRAYVRAQLQGDAEGGYPAVQLGSLVLPHACVPLQANALPCTRLSDAQGKYDDLPEMAFYMVGTTCGAHLHAALCWAVDVMLGACQVNLCQC